MATARNDSLTTAGTLQLSLGQARFAGASRIELLRQIDATGSITGAAKACGISYKLAWDSIDAMNNLSAEPLVMRRTGGRHGGSSELTDAGRRLIQVFEAADQAHRQFLARLSESIQDFDQFYPLLGVLNMKVSTRNHLRCVVTAVKPGTVNAEVTLDLDGTALVAVITNESVQTLGLASGKEAFALIKASFVILTTADGSLQTSARNRLCGTVERIVAGSVDTEVVLALAGGTRLTSIITQASATNLGLAEGDQACALIKAPHIILAVSE